MKKEDGVLVSNMLPAVFFVQHAVLAFSVLIWVYVANNNVNKDILCFVYPLIAAGWVFIMGNGRLSMNIAECKYVKDVTEYRFKKYIYITSSRKSKMAMIDFIYQVAGYILILVGLILSTIVFFLSKSSLDPNVWSNYSNPYHFSLIIYLIVVFVLSTIIRSYFYYIDYRWNKNKK